MTAATGIATAAMQPRAVSSPAAVTGAEAGLLAADSVSPAWGSGFAAGTVSTLLFSGSSDTVLLPKMAV